MVWRAASGDTRPGQREICVSKKRKEPPSARVFVSTLLCKAGSEQYFNVYLCFRLGFSSLQRPGPVACVHSPGLGFHISRARSLLVCAWVVSPSVRSHPPTLGQAPTRHVVRMRLRRWSRRQFSKRTLSLSFVSKVVFFYWLLWSVTFRIKCFTIKFTILIHTKMIILSFILFLLCGFALYTVLKTYCISVEWTEVISWKLRYSLSMYVLYIIPMPNYGCVCPNRQ